jgi:membrane protein
MRRSEVTGFFREVAEEWQNDNALTQGAALAYYALFSLTPLLVLVIIVAGLALGRAAAQGEVVRQVQGLVGADTAQVVEGMVSRASTPAAGIVPTVVSLLVMALGASGLIGQLRASLNHIWGAAPRATSGVRSMLRQRLVSLAFVGGIGLLLLLSVVLTAVLAAVQDVVIRHLPVFGRFLPALNFALSLVLAIAFFAMIFHALPDVELHWRDVAFGSVMTALLFTIGKSLIGLYLGHTGATSIYGAAGSLVLLLLWVYYSAQILLLGAEFTEVWSRRYGSRRAADHSAPRHPESAPT